MKEGWRNLHNEELHNLSICLSVCLSISGSTALCWALAAFSFLIFYIVCRTLWTGDQPVARTLPTQTGQHKHGINAQTSVPQVEFEPTISVFERAALDCAATVIGLIAYTFRQIILE
jgi:hypothetical protein